MQIRSLLSKQILWGIKTWQLLAVFGLYLFFAVQFWATLFFTANYYRNVWREAIIDYFILKALLTLPLWWLYFRKLKARSLSFKLLLHVLTAPVWIFCWFHLYRFIQDLRGGWYLEGNGIWWDVYIPGLFYCVQFAVFHLYDYYLQTQKQKEIEKKLLSLAHHSEINALKAQIQPHFLFNTLNSISASVPANLEHTREMIAQLADTFRYGLRALQRELVPLAEEVHFIKQCLELEKERFGDRLSICYEIDENILQHQVPPMLLQPLVENAVKHGIAKSIEGGTITIKIFREKDKMAFEVNDTGKGIVDEQIEKLFQKGVGLSNTQKRLQYLFEESITVQKNIPCGTRIRFAIPVNLK